MKLQYLLETTVTFSSAVTDHVFRLHATPMEGAHQTRLETRLCVSPSVPLATQRDAVTGNQSHCGRIAAPHSHFQFLSEGILLTGSQRSDNPPPFYLSAPTPLTAPRETIRHFWHSLQPRTHFLSDRAYVAYVIDAIHATMHYVSGSTHIGTTAEEALGNQTGVCQDYAHILISLLRLSGIVSYYTAGLLPGEGATHAWVDVWADGQWHGFDPTHNRSCDESYIMLARGADFSYAPIERGVFCGTATQAIKTRALVTSLS